MRTIDTLDHTKMTDADILAELKRLAYEAMERLDKRSHMTPSAEALCASLQDVVMYTTMVALDDRERQ